MTMNVSVRVPDGIVIASDSLATSLIPMQAQFQIGPRKCEKCGHETGGEMIQMPPVGVPGYSTPLASKLFYIDNYGLAFFGASALNRRSMFNHIMVYRTTIHKAGMQLAEIADKLAEQLVEAASNDPNAAKAKDGTELGGFQISGYNDEDVDIGRTAIVTLRKGQDPARQDEKQEYGVTVTGQQAVVQMLFSKVAGGATAVPRFHTMTVPDAIDYARFLVQTTSDYHRFADMVPLVGGPTEIALITKWIGFRWVERKKILGADTTRLNIGKIAHELGSLRRDIPALVRTSTGCTQDGAPKDG